MQLTDSFVVDAGADALWAILTDVERVAPCVPGFELLEVAGDDFRGRMKVKVGAITVQYEVTVSFVERDEAARRARLAVRGSENRGSGSVTAALTATLADQGGRTRADMVTDVQVTGKVAQFGRGIMADVSSRIVEQFVSRLEATILAPPAEAVPSAATAGAGAASASGSPDGALPRLPGRPAGGEVEPLDLGAAALLPTLKRFAPLLIAFLVGRLSVRLLGGPRR